MHTLFIELYALSFQHRVRTLWTVNANKVRDSHKFSFQCVHSSKSTLLSAYPFMYQWIVLSGFIQYILDGALYILWGHRL